MRSHPFFLAIAFPRESSDPPINGLLTIIGQFVGRITSVGVRKQGKQTMEMSQIFVDNHRDSFTPASPGDLHAADLLVAQYLAMAVQGDPGACFDLGVLYSTGGRGIAGDLVEAHKWFNLASMSDHEDAKTCRADIAEEMTAREIAEAQRRARQWIAATTRRAA